MNSCFRGLPWRVLRDEKSTGKNPTVGSTNLYKHYATHLGVRGVTMGVQSLQNGNLRLRVAHSFDTDGKTQLQAGVKYGARQPTLKEVHPFFLNDSLWEQNKGILGPVRPINTASGIILLNKPLAEAIQTDGKSGGKPERFIVDASDGVTSRVPVTDAFLQALAAAGMKMADSGLIVFERTFTVIDKGNSSYEITIENPSVNLRVGYLNSILSDGWTETGKHPVLFGQGGESLPVYLWFSRKPVKIGFASAGGDGFYLRRVVDVGLRSGGRFGVLVKEQDYNALAVAVETTEKQFGAGSQQH